MSEQADRYFDVRMEMLPPGQLRKLQDHRLRWQFRRCWDSSAWYRARFEAAGLTPETFGGLADLQRIPLLSDAHLAGLRHTDWLVAPAEWISDPAFYLRPRFAWQTLGDRFHEQDRLARANWAAIRWNIFRSWPPECYTDKRHLRRYWPTWLSSDSRRRIYLLNERSAGNFLAYECAERRGRHWVDDQLLAEIINPKSGQSVSDGTAGELVVTDLVREAAPLIRYRTGLRRILTHEACACGRTSSVIWTAQAFRAAQNARS